MSQEARVLLVDDDADLREILRVVLEGAGYIPILAASGPQGLEAADRERPDLILLDVMMPEGTEGFHVVWKLRNLEDPYFKTVPIVILTAIHQQTDLRFYPDAGDGTYGAGEYLPVQGFVDKPVSPEALLKEVERVLRVAGRSG
jgi:CheY-like chemotaxis protein